MLNAHLGGGRPHRRAHRSRSSTGPRASACTARSRRRMSRLTQSLAAELYDDGIAVNAAAPSESGRDRGRRRRSTSPRRTPRTSRSSPRRRSASAPVTRRSLTGQVVADAALPARGRLARGLTRDCTDCLAAHPGGKHAWTACDGSCRHRHGALAAINAASSAGRVRNGEWSVGHSTTASARVGHLPLSGGWQRAVLGAHHVGGGDGLATRALPRADRHRASGAARRRPSRRCRVAVAVEERRCLCRVDGGAAVGDDDGAEHRALVRGHDRQLVLALVGHERGEVDEAAHAVDTSRSLRDDDPPVRVTDDHDAGPRTLDRRTRSRRAPSPRRRPDR